MDYRLKIAAAIQTLAEFDFPAPKTSIYLGLGVNLGQFNAIETALVQSDLIRANSQTWELTEKGKGLANEIQDVISDVSRNG